MHNQTKTNTELPQTMGSTLNNRSPTTERTAAYATGGDAKMHFTSAKS